MTDSEAAFIAWHFINAGLADKTDVTANESVKLISSILQIVEESFQTKLDTEDWNYQRFLTHLKFFAVRLLTHATYEDAGDEELLADLRKKCRPVANCVDRVADFIHPHQPARWPNATVSSMSKNMMTEPAPSPAGRKNLSIGTRK